MSISVQIGLLFAVATAFASVLGFLYKHRGAVESPEVEWRRPIRSSLMLFRSGWYTLGILVATAGWGFHVAALSLAPISLVQSVIAGGLVLLTVIADRLFAHEVSRREWVGVALAALGLAFLAATLEGAGEGAHSSYAAGTLALYVGTVSALAIFVVVFGQRVFGHAGVLLGLAAGMLWAASDTAIKALSDEVDRGVAVVLDPLTAFIALASLAGLLVSAKSLQLGRAVPVIAVTSVGANALTIAAGPLVFSEPVPDDALGLTVRILAFVLVIGAAALTPAPVAVTEDDPPMTDPLPEST